MLGECSSTELQPQPACCVLPGSSPQEYQPGKQELHGLRDEVVQSTRPRLWCSGQPAPPALDHLPLRRSPGCCLPSNRLHLSSAGSHRGPERPLPTGERRPWKSHTRAEDRGLDPSAQGPGLLDDRMPNGAGPQAPGARGRQRKHRQQEWLGASFRAQNPSQALTTCGSGAASLRAPHPP